MEGDLGLNEIHSDLISDYLRFSKYQLSQRIKSIDYCFTSLLNCRVRNNETYTGEEVKTLLQDLQDVVHGETETELNDGIHTNALLMKELLSQAEEWHLTLTADISELENREKLSVVKNFDEKISANPKMNITVTQAKQIIPVEDMNVATALKKEIVRLTLDNNSLKSQLQDFENQILSKPQHDESESIRSESEQAKFQLELKDAHEEIDNLRFQLISFEQRRGSQSQMEMKTVKDAVDKLSKELESSKASAEEQTEKLKKDLEARESKLRQVQSNLLLAEKELDKKFQATSAYTNMKKILVQKNTKIKNMRKKLETLGGLDGADEDEEEEGGFRV